MRKALTRHGDHRRHGHQHYDETTYVYTATIAVDGTGTLSLVSAGGSVASVTGTGSISQTSDNHGEYVAGTIDDYGRPRRAFVHRQAHHKKGEVATPLTSSATPPSCTDGGVVASADAGLGPVEREHGPR